MQVFFVNKFRKQIDLSYQGDVTTFQEITRQIEEITQVKVIELIREIAKKERAAKNLIIHQKMQQSIQDLIQMMRDGENPAP